VLGRRDSLAKASRRESGDHNGLPEPFLPRVS
jgi:hypothetical protein